MFCTQRYEKIRSCHTDLKEWPHDQIAETFFILVHWFLLQFVQTFYLAHNDHPRVLCFIRQYRQRHSEEDSPQHEIKAKSRSRSRSRSRDRDKHSSRSNRDREKDRRGDSHSRSHSRRSRSKGREKGPHKKSRSDQHRYELLHKLWLCVSYSNLGTRLFVQTPCRLPSGYFIKYWQVCVQ